MTDITVRNKMADEVIDEAPPTVGGTSTPVDELTRVDIVDVDGVDEVEATFEPVDEDEAAAKAAAGA